MKTNKVLTLVAFIVIFLLGILLGFYLKSTQNNDESSINLINLFEKPGSEKYCRSFSIDKCPSVCQTRPSCPICMDIGCHAK